MSTVTSSPASAASGNPAHSARPRLHFLDGIRGVAALLVVIHHMWLHSFLSANETGYPLWFRAISILKQGHYVVAVFIVLSGFCLMLPVTMSNGVMTHGVSNYLKRRAKRILPPYFAALAFACALLALFPVLRIDDGTIFSPFHRADMPGSFVTHLLLLHNFIPHWAHRIDGPMWSVATEWQIYFIFPALLLPAWRRWGNAAPIAIGLALGLCTVGTQLEEACLWYISLFAMGMAACSLCFTKQESGDLPKLSWPRLWGIFAVTTVIALGVAHKFHSLQQPCFDVIIGTLTAFLLIYCTRHAILAAPNGGPAVVRILASRPLIALGTFSYSLYLIHFPLLYVIKSQLLPHHMSTPTNFLIYLVVGLPVILVLSYLFHRVFERPFMNFPSAKAH